MNDKQRYAVSLLCLFAGAFLIWTALGIATTMAHAQYGQADLFPYLEEMSYPGQLPPAVIEQLQAGVPAGSYGNITLTLDPLANPLDVFGILEQSDIPAAYMEYDPDYDYAAAASTDAAAASTSAVQPQGHVYIIVERTPSMSVDPNLVIGLQSQLSTTVVDLQAQVTQVTQIVVAGVVVTVVGGMTALALRGQGILSGLASRIGRGANKDDA